MRSWSRREPPAARVPDAVLLAAGLRRRDVMAAAPSGDTWLVAARDALREVSATAVDETGTPALVRTTAWVDLDLADWDSDADRLVLVPSDAQEDPWSLPLESAGDLLVVIRERISATLVLERHAALDDQRLTVVCRRRSVGGELVWRVRYAVGTDPEDPGVRRAAAELLRRTREEVGDASSS